MTTVEGRGAEIVDSGGAGQVRGLAPGSEEWRGMGGAGSTAYNVWLGHWLTMVTVNYKKYGRIHIDMVMMIVVNSQIVQALFSSPSQQT